MGICVYHSYLTIFKFSVLQAERMKIFFIGVHAHMCEFLVIKFQEINYFVKMHILNFERALPNCLFKRSP